MRIAETPFNRCHRGPHEEMRGTVFVPVDGGGRRRGHEECGWYDLTPAREEPV